VPIPVIVDCDPGTDDALAILLALASPELTVLGITVAAGNVGLDHTLRNACALARKLRYTPALTVRYLVPSPVL
jgi:inosine-uridine nucleoside N-ribohydrolase